MAHIAKYLIITAVILAAIGLLFGARDKNRVGTGEDREPPMLSSEEKSVPTRIEHFSEMNPAMRFSAFVPLEWETEYVPSVEAVNLSDQIFVRYFQANDFLTLSTVNIISREDDTINGHAAVRYVIEKKAGVPDFAGQPEWRSRRHAVTDIRLTGRDQTYFYVFARNPELDDELFEDFLRNILFHNDAESYSQPINRSAKRVTKKTFGIYVTPENSPVQPERFTGFHSGTDYEIFAGEEQTEVGVLAVCGGPLRQKTTASGYGGVVVQECLLQNEPITVVYGHLDIRSVPAPVGQYLAPGEKIGCLGTGESAQTDGARKHLHLGMHKGTNSDIRGYVQNESELDAFIDVRSVLK
jgi:hypothetical protein